MIREYQLTIGDICGDSTLRVRVEDVDIYERVHFTVIERTDENPEESEEMSLTAFARRFTRIGRESTRGKAA